MSVTNCVSCFLLHDSMHGLLIHTGMCSNLDVSRICPAYSLRRSKSAAGPKTVDDFTHQPLTQPEVELIKVLWEESCSCLGMQSCTCGLNNGNDKLFPSGCIPTYTCCLDLLRLQARHGSMMRLPMAS
ncbi:TPA: hypothetical protein ACH3X1_000841 [Trebouxia sp. C0004]